MTYVYLYSTTTWKATCWFSRAPRNPTPNLSSLVFSKSILATFSWYQMADGRQRTPLTLPLNESKFHANCVPLNLIPGLTSLSKISLLCSPTFELLNLLPILEKLINTTASSAKIPLQSNSATFCSLYVFHTVISTPPFKFPKLTMTFTFRIKKPLLILMYLFLPTPLPPLIFLTSLNRRYWHRRLACQFLQWLIPPWHQRFSYHSVPPCIQH